MDNFKITKTILENINEQNDRINECVDIVNGYTTDEETRVNQELERQQNELRREEQYNNNENRFAVINEQLETKANLNSVFTMANMGQDVKEAMTGGSVAIVGKDAVLKENIVDGAVIRSKSSFYIKTRNLFDKEKATFGKYVSSGSGNLLTPSTSDSYYASDYIEVDSSQAYSMSSEESPYTTWAFYDVNKNFISGKTGYLTNIISPENAKYIRFSVWKNVNPSTVQLEKGEAPTQYIKPYLFEKEEQINKNSDDILVLKSITNSQFSNLTINCLGDSITYGYLTDTTRMEKPYPTLLKELLGFAESRNYGVSGTCIAENRTLSPGNLPMYLRYQEMNDNANFVTVKGGTNDYFAQVPIGNITDKQGNTFYGALNILAAGLITKYPNAIIVFMTPLQNRFLGKNIDLIEYATAIKNICKKYSLPCLDLYSIGGLCPNNTTKYTVEGTHPTQEFNTNILSKRIGAFLKSIYI